MEHDRAAIGVGLATIERREKKAANGEIQCALLLADCSDKLQGCPGAQDSFGTFPGDSHIMFQMPQSFEAPPPWSFCCGQVIYCDIVFFVVR